MPEKSYRILEHTADIGIKAYGADLKQAYVNAAKGLFSLITDMRKIKAVTFRDIDVNAADADILLVTWLNELIYLFDTENILFRQFQISELQKTRLKARAYGEKVDSRRHAIKIGVKSTTYHMLRIEQTDNGYLARVIFDI